MAEVNDRCPAAAAVASTDATFITFETAFAVVTGQFEAPTDAIPDALATVAA